MGAFDGVHLGHQAIIRQASDICRDGGEEFLLITFNCPPKYFFRLTNKYLLDIQEKAVLFEQLGINHLLVLEFSEQLSQMGCDEFFQSYLYSPWLVNFFWGHDFAFGKDKQGDLAFIQQKAREKGFNVLPLPIFDLDGQRISSSEIRELLIAGEVHVATKYLGREYSMQGKVVAGHHLGHQLGFPTANLNWDENKLLPKIGVYHTITIWQNQEYLSITNIGHRPSVKLGKKSDVSIETHLLNFNGDLYGETISLKFIRRVRDEICFDSYKELSQQIQKDIAFVMASQQED